MYRAAHKYRHTETCTGTHTHSQGPVRVCSPVCYAWHTAPPSRAEADTVTGLLAVLRLPTGTGKGNLPEQGVSLPAPGHCTGQWPLPLWGAIAPFLKHLHPATGCVCGDTREPGAPNPKEPVSLVESCTRPRNINFISDSTKSWSLQKLARARQRDGPQGEALVLGTQRFTGSPEPSQEPSCSLKPGALSSEGWS